MRDLERFINQDELLAADLLIKMALTRCTTRRSDGCTARNIALQMTRCTPLCAAYSVQAHRARPGQTATAPAPARPVPESDVNQPPMQQTPEDLQRIAERTLAHYDRNAQAFWEGTRDHDVSQNIDALLRHIEATPPFEILDFGCGPGRDLKTFRALGHRVTGLEGSPQLAALARVNSGCVVLEQNFLALALPSERFDGVFANAVLFHVPSLELPRVLGQLNLALKPGGVLFCSNPRGDGQEGWNGERYGAFHDWPAWHAYASAAGFVELSHYYRPPGLPREQQPWLASVWRKAPG